MATEQGYTVLPLSALKNHVVDLFEALKAGTTVYISKHSQIVAAFRPHMYVPEGVAAVYTSPHLDLPTITAREIGRQSLSQVIAEAAAGFPAVAMKDSRIYGMLTPATAPQPDTVPDPAAVGAKAEALRVYQENNPEAPIADIMAFSRSLDPGQQEQLPLRTWPLAAEFDDPVAVHDDIKAWRKQGSAIEDIVEDLIEALGQGITAVGEKCPTAAAPTVPGLAHLARAYVTRTGILEELASSLGGFLPSSTRIFITHAEQLEAAGDPVDARTGYVHALAAELAIEPIPNVGVMWRLGNLARHTQHPAEAKLWFRLSLAYNAIAEIGEDTVDESVFGVVPSEML